MTRRDDGTIAAYDAVAPHYREIAARRAAYLAGVDRIVLESAPGGAQAMLDVGAGDGVRAAALAASAGIRSFVLAEPSSRMAEACRLIPGGEVWTVRAEELPAPGRTFDVITCLWNVLGHVPGRAARIEALRRMGALLAPRGVIVLDVNHRYNAAAYGWLATLGRRVVDVIAPGDANGDVPFAWSVGGGQVRGVGHVFTGAELDALVDEAGLRTVRGAAVDYETGAERRSSWSGQLVRVLAAAPG